MRFQDVLNNTNSSLSIIFLVFKLPWTRFNNLKLNHKFIEENILYQAKELKEDHFHKHSKIVEKSPDINNKLFEIFKIEIKQGTNVLEEKLEKLSPQNEKIFEIDKIEIKQSANEYFKKIKIEDYLPLGINLLSCKCRKPEVSSNNKIFDLIYEYYQLMIDVSNIFIKLYHIENFNVLKNSGEKIFLIKIVIKNLFKDLKSISIFKINRFKKK